MKCFVLYVYFYVYGCVVCLCNIGYFIYNNFFLCCSCVWILCCVIINFLKVEGCKVVVWVYLFVVGCNSKVLFSIWLMEKIKIFLSVKFLWLIGIILFWLVLI